MNYTIAVMIEREKDDPLTLDIEKCGHKYIVHLRNEAHKTTSRTFYTLDEAYGVFEKLASWMIYGRYTEAERRRFLETGRLIEGGC